VKAASMRRAARAPSELPWLPTSAAAAVEVVCAWTGSAKRGV